MLLNTEIPCAGTNADFASDEYSGLQNQKKILFLNQNICCWYSKESSQLNGSFGHPKHMLKIVGKKIFTIVYAEKFCLSIPRTHWLRVYIFEYYYQKPCLFDVFASLLNRLAYVVLPKGPTDKLYICILPKGQCQV